MDLQAIFRAAGRACSLLSVRCCEAQKTGLLEPRAERVAVVLKTYGKEVNPMFRLRMVLRGVVIAAFVLPAVLVTMHPYTAVAAIEPATGAPPSASPAIIAPDCPVSAEELSTSGGLSVCVDRGEGSTYAAGDRITVCASANIPMIAIYPPPPPPTIRVESTVGSSTRTLLEDQFAEGHRCLTGTIAPPFGQETVRVQAIRLDGTAFLEDTATFTTRPR
jgi:hypothetical protein